MWKIKEIALFLEKSAEKFCRFKKTSTFALAIEKKNISFADIGIWCNGNTTDSGPVIPGSSPGIPTHTVRHLSVMKGVFLFIGILFYGVFITINPRAFALGFIVFISSRHQ